MPGQTVVIEGIQDVLNHLAVSNHVKLPYNFDFEVPTQAAWLTHPDWGITARLPIFLEPPGKIFNSASVLERAA